MLPDNRKPKSIVATAFWILQLRYTRKLAPLFTRRGQYVTAILVIVAFAIIAWVLLNNCVVGGAYDLVGISKVIEQGGLQDHSISP